jgi:hypothetical protein
MAARVYGMTQYIANRSIRAAGMRRAIRAKG